MWKLISWEKVQVLSSMERGMRLNEEKINVNEEEVMGGGGRGGKENSGNEE
jgi:hypothetical protein